jgi:molecular chaperone DnaK (HSP70)
MSYGLGIDVGTTFSAGAIHRAGRVDVVALESQRFTVPTVVAADGDRLVFGSAAVARSVATPDAAVREFKRRLGDPEPIVVGGRPYLPEHLVAAFARWVRDNVAAQCGGPPDHLAVSHPANWTAFQRQLLAGALADAELAPVVLIAEPEAAAIDFASVAQLAAGELVLVYDLGGGTFDVALLRRDADGFETVGDPRGVERLGGIDFDQAVFQYVLRATSAEPTDPALADPAGRLALDQLRARCVEAKELLSTQGSVEVPVFLPGVTATVAVTRAAFEDMVRPMLRQTVELVHQTMERARVSAQELSNVLLVGGSSRIPMVSTLIEQDLGVPVRVDTHPKLVVARGAARRAGTASERSAAMPAPPLSAPVAAPSAPAMAPPPPPTAPTVPTEAAATTTTQGRSARLGRGAVTAPKPAAADAVLFVPDDDHDGASWQRPVMLAVAAVLVAAIVVALVFLL